ncbi:Ppx/GppA family phosphatase [Pseudemcibacter aquimaris]|uniref:Ppx/GppA family phosphatase n=1 Tax=Pseudemcibacter aquimaris TaxID=2857064 RepID=UPI0020130E54|nr:Ppx/GppA family phosphatase [Pseudemcibacter aquimaris]MCC3861097.1 Ppx/GppA family phosphatase [Pseudemcibacter aquimaris]WDU59915.1 Ppx/GppA family phosphatase [Pseudemcibacter aquimaris]
MSKFAIIDIGSNTVRLVVYENRERAPYVIFNEKVFCGLGRGVTDTGNMIDDAMDLAAITLKRFAMLIDKMGINDPRIVATSAVRDADNGPAFVERIKEYTGLTIEVIQGVEEARLSANGVICALPHADGVIADLGGGSLELATIKNRVVENECTLPIGPLRLQDQTGHWFDHPKRRVKKNLATIEWLDANKGRKFYAVGGAWRSLARIHMDMIDYPHVNMHNYIMPVNEVMSLAKKISKMSLVEVYQYRGLISEKRARIISLASLSLYHLLKTLKPSKFVVSAFGIREGVLYDGMSDEVRSQDPLIVGCHQVAEMTGRFPEHGERLYNWIDPLFDGESDEQKRLRLAICILSDVGWRGHPEYRADKVVGEILYGRLGGISHWGVGLISMALYTCYGGSRQYSDQVETAASLISRHDLAYAKKIGLALRLAQRLSAGTERGLKLAKLEMSEDELIFKVNKEKRDIINDVVVKRLESLARLCDLDAKIKNI